MIRTRLYRGGELVEKDFPPERISEVIVHEDAAVWLDLCQPTAEDLDLLREELGLHALAVEDALDANQRSKVDHYEGHLFLTAYTAKLVQHDRLESSEIGVFVTPRAMVTIRRDQRFDIDQVVKRWDKAAEMAKYGVAFLLHGLLDYVVDCHLQVVEDLDEALEKVEDLLFDDRNHPPRTVQRRVLRLRRSLVHLRRAVLPMREVVNSLIRDNSGVVPPEMIPYYQDVYDHVLRATEWTESLRDLVTTVMDTSLIVQGNRMNNIMKKVTSWAAIIAVPTAVTGFYGQNVPYPGSQQTWGFITSSLITVLLSIGLYVMFRRRDWL